VNIGVVVVAIPRAPEIRQGIDEATVGTAAAAGDISEPIVSILVFVVITTVAGVVHIRLVDPVIAVVVVIGGAVFGGRRIDSTPAVITVVSAVAARSAAAGGAIPIIVGVGRRTMNATVHLIAIVLGTTVAIIAIVGTLAVATDAKLSGSANPAAPPAIGGVFEDIHAATHVGTTVLAVVPATVGAIVAATAVPLVAGFALVVGIRFDRNSSGRLVTVP
jgi:hypothetical protein